MLISESYRDLNQRLHEEKPHYGAGCCLSEAVKQICAVEKTKDVLDYGCGKCALEAALGFSVQNYDPAIPWYSKDPVPADIVACADVLEHIEPECLQDVLDHLKSLTKRVMIASVHIGPANKHLPDGRNAHLTQMSREWWLGQLMRRFTLLQYMRAEQHAIFVMGNGDLYRAG